MGKHAKNPEHLFAGEREMPEKGIMTENGVVAQMPVAAEVGSGDERDELGSG